MLTKLYAIGTGKILISTHVVIFSSDSHKRKRTAEYSTLISRETEKNYKKIRKIFGTEISEPLDLKLSEGGGGHAPRPPYKLKSGLRRLRQYLSEKIIPI